MHKHLLHNLHERYFDVNPPTADGEGAEPSDNAPGEKCQFVELMTSKYGFTWRGSSGEDDDIAFEREVLYDPTHYDIAVVLEGALIREGLRVEHVARGEA